MNNRVFGLVMLILGGLLLAFMATGSLAEAPLIMVFGTLGGLASVALAIWALAGKY